MSKKQRRLPDKINFRATRPASLEEASAVKRVPPPVFHLDSQAPQPLTPGAARQLQRQIGNRAVGRLFNQARPPVIQTKLQVGPANDKYEQEADQVAQQIMQTPKAAEATHARGVSTLQRVGGEGGFEAGREVESRIAAQRGGGRPLPASVRAQVEPRLGADFSGVRVHTDAAAEDLNQSLNARAFTTGRDIFFGRGEYQPRSSAGQQLLAHELTHVVQQNQGRVAHQSVSGQKPASVQRKPKKAENGIYVDDKIPGATLGFVSTDGKSSSYEIKENGIRFTFVNDGNYYLNDEEVDPGTLYTRWNGGDVEPEILDNPLKRKRGPNEEEEDDSDDNFSVYSLDEDDESINDLTHTAKMSIIMDKGKEKQKSFKRKKFDTDDKGVPLHEPYARKVYSVHRSSGDSRFSNINNQELISVGQQILRLGEGTGYFMQAGGNQDERQEGIKEPDSDYHNLFEGLKGMGGDKNAQPLYQLAWNQWVSTEEGSTAKFVEETLTDAQVALMVFHYFTNNVQELESKLQGRTQLTETLSKLIAIFGVSEMCRSLEGKDEKEKPSPYDVTLLIKQGLLKVMEGKLTLQAVFYQGQGGENSIFLGAPSQKNSSKEVGGSDQLRYPFYYDKALERQMGIFSNNQREFKEELNSLRSSSDFKLPELTVEDEQKAQAMVAQQQVQNVQALIDEINRIEVPGENYINEFLNEPNGTIKKFTKNINKLAKQVKGNEEALEKIKEARGALKQKVVQATPTAKPVRKRKKPQRFNPH